MSKYLKLAIFFLLFIFINKSYAQYTILERVDATPKKYRDSIFIPKTSNFYVESDAVLKELRRKRRNERNFFETKTGILFNQFAYANWSGGGENTYNGKITTLNTHSYQNKKFSVDSYFNAQLGFGKKDSTLWKTDDYFEINSVLNYQLYGRWNWSFGVNLASQFAKGYGSNKDVYLSTFFAPATLRPFLGISYKVSETKIITFAPVSGNLLFVLDTMLSNKGAFGITPGKKFKPTIGAYINIQWEQQIDKQGILKYKTNLQSFCDYKSVPNLSWENWINVSVMKYFTVGLYIHVVFNDKIERQPGRSFWQLKETIGVGISYNFKNKENKPDRAKYSKIANYKL